MAKSNVWIDGGWSSHPFSWRFLIWWVWIGSWSSLSPQLWKVWRQSHPNEYGPANIANERKLSGLDTALWDFGQPLSFGKAITRDAHCPKSTTSIGKSVKGLFIEEIGRNSFVRNLAMIVILAAASSQCKLSLKIYEERQGKTKNDGKEGTSTQSSILDRNDSQNIQNKEAFYGSNHICLIPDGDLWRFRCKVTWSSFERHIFELFGVSLSADHKITRITSHTPKIWLKKLGMVQTPMIRISSQAFFPKQGWFSNEHVCNKDLCAFVGNTGLLSNLARVR